jgi:hypothetical protein
MKNRCQRSLALLVCVTLGLGLCEATAQTTLTNSYTNTFDTGGVKIAFAGTGSVASWVYWYGLGYNNTLMTNDPTMDAQGKTNTSGSLLVYSPFGASGGQDVFFGTFDNISPYDNTEVIPSSMITNLSFDIHVAPGTRLSSAGDFGTITMALIDPAWGGNFNYFTAITIPAAATNGWVHLSDTNIFNDISSFINAGFANAAGVEYNYNSFNGYPTNAVKFWIDNVAVTTGVLPAVPLPTNAISIAVDAQLNRRAISPLIYGVAFATSNQLLDLNFTMNRSGGDNETRYNWLINAHNLDNDYFFESYPESSATPGAFADSHIANSKSGGAQPLITIPMIGWMPKLGDNRSILYSYSVAKYGPQTLTDPDLPDAGNGVSSPSGVQITNNDPNDANFLTNSAFQLMYQQHLLTTWGSSTNGGVQYYIMDNEHSLWFSTQRDVHPVGATMQEILGKIIEYAGMVKSNDPNALVCAPEEWGWDGYLYSGYDQQWFGAHNDFNPADFPDRTANGGLDYMPWLLGQIHQHDTNTGGRLLDYFTLHCYPAEDNVAGSDASPATALLRNQTTRIFWDSNYVDPSYINDVIMLIPRMKNWVASNYPGTKIGITEYNWGAETSMNGATAEADLLGIFGREGLDLATWWEQLNGGTLVSGTLVNNAMKIYRNYDGNKSTFGDTSVSANVSTNVDDVSSFAAVRSTDGALTIMVINKQSSAFAGMTLTLTNFSEAGTAKVWQLNASNIIARLSDVAFSGNTLSAVVPAQSITLFILPAASVLAPPPPSLAGVGSMTPNTITFGFTNGVASLTYILQSSTNLINWSPVQTNTLTTTSNSYTFSTSNAARFYRAQWLP